MVRIVHSKDMLKSFYLDICKRSHVQNIDWRSEN